MQTGPLLIEETFQISGRGVVVAVAQVTALPVGKALRASVVLPDGRRLGAEAWKEWLLRRHPVTHEKEAYLLRGLEKSQIPEGSSIEISI